MGLTNQSTRRLANVLLVVEGVCYFFQGIFSSFPWMSLRFEGFVAFSCATGVFALLTTVYIFPSIEEYMFYS